MNLPQIIAERVENRKIEAWLRAAQDNPHATLVPSERAEQAHQCNRRFRQRLANQRKGQAS